MSTWVLSKKQMRRGLACLSLLLLLMLLQFETPCFAGVCDHKLNRFKAAGTSGAGLTPNSKSQGGFKGSNTAKNGDVIFGAEQRKVYTGPNPLHNR